MFSDTVLFANAINVYPNITNQQHYDFLMSIIKPRKRFSKWPKPITHKANQAVSKYFNIPIREAGSIVSLFSQQQLDQIIEVVSQVEK